MRVQLLCTNLVHNISHANAFSEQKKPPSEVHVLNPFQISPFLSVSLFPPLVILALLSAIVCLRSTFHITFQ